MQKQEKLKNTEASLTKYLNNFLTDVEKNESLNES